ncbi:MAG: hypothetical protein M3072_17130 [Candidatus Dormibacteraeota bacterium]|nr:hypothetical protein [Candidatus Dormibacteraeota bacterium]
MSETAVTGHILSHDLGPGLRKGTRLGPEHAAALRNFPEVHVVVLEPGDLHEDEAGRRLARAVAGPGLRLEGPVQSQARLVAERRGLLRVDREAVVKINRLSGVSIFTLVDGQAVDMGEDVAGAKVTPVVVGGLLVAEAEQLAAQGGDQRVVRLLPFRPLRTLVVVTERLKPKARGLFFAAVSRKLGWFGADLIGLREVARDEAAVRAAYDEAGRASADLIVFAGASSIDPLDPAYSELRAAGGHLIRQGAPAHPGSMLWVGRLQEATVLGVASCAGFGKDTSLDLVLPFVFAYGSIDELDFAQLGYGGLIEKAAGRRFPPYA